MKYIPAFLLLIIFSSPAFSQSSNFIKGKVINGETNAVIANASVFITNTSKGTVSSSTGLFELQNVPEGTYDLVVSCIGFETQVYTYKSSQLPLNMLIKLAPKVEELEAVVVEPYEKDGWEKWGKFFLENFIGTSANANDCTIKNYNVLHFRNSKKKNQLTVIADEPLIIQNRALGYNVQYQLENFTYNFKENMLTYLGYCLFTESNKKGPKPRHLRNRDEAYNGSIQHFMFSLYNNRLAEEGFEVKRLARTPNLEKQRVREVYRQMARSKHMQADSSAYYERILKQPDMLETYGSSLLTADSLLTNNDALTKKLSFDNYLYVVYKNEKEEPKYLQYTNENRPTYFQRSVAFLPNGKGVFINELGNYYMPLDFMSYGYWGWSEKIASLLPFDYEHPKK
ncbi:MAG: carboxypeptidase-like regulatory domain-containing protein [Chitinophagaceae bacterium]